MVADYTMLIHLQLIIVPKVYRPYEGRLHQHSLEIRASLDFDICPNANANWLDPTYNMGYRLYGTKPLISPRRTFVYCIPSHLAPIHFQTSVFRFYPSNAK